MRQIDLDRWHMTRALALAARGRGLVEPNPLVGCLIAQGAELVGEGWHRRFGGPHAEVEALTLAGSRALGATAYVTLEPCCHHGKTPPCTKALLAAGVARVVAAMGDPFPAVAGQGTAELRAAGVAVDVGLLEDEARWLNAPYLKLLSAGRPWVIAKWAMTLDGRIATHTRESRWISSAASRAIAHQLRGWVDAVIVGRGTVLADDPLLTARPPGPRTPVRIVLDSQATLAEDSQLVRTARESPVLVACCPSAPAAARQRLMAAGCEVFACPGETYAARFDALLAELGRRRMTNVLVEGGSEVLGSLVDTGAIDEVHAFVAPQLIGGQGAPAPIGGQGIASLNAAPKLVGVEVRTVDGDVYVHGRVARAGQ
ncbi:MAG: bifunctional diaminohydroxyphosphoribosylaminopyrimidine deaminase/5-amino-6-(5-phosphoribosylamino)uracil reductase RibD [Pirellulales bacterium]